MRLATVVIAAFVLIVATQAASGFSTASQSGIYKIRLDGTHRTRLFENRNLQVVLDLSPNRKRVLAEYSGQNDELYAAAIDGTRQKLVVRLPGNRYVERAVYSPDGTRVAIGAVETPCETCMSFEIWLVKANGTGLRRLVRAGLAPSWSPDSRRVAYVGSFEPFLQEGEVSVVNAIGSPVERRIRPPEHGDYSDWSVAWSPRGDWIAYSTGFYFYGHSTMRIVRPSGKGAVRKIEGGLGGWSTSGDRLAYWDYGSKRLTTLSPDSGRRLALSFGLDRDPVAWSPNGRWIAFVRRVSTNCYQLFAVRSNGRSRHRLTHEACPAFFHPFWSRDGRSVLYTLAVG